ncbi:MAG: hypothetical protein KJ579_09125, partial [Verrucomicrobia bacterium]|nr:hypothetical protein [Verrucomicrobiota bacterium]
DVTADWRPNQANEIRAWDDYPNRLYCSDFRIVHVLEVVKVSIDRIAFNFDPASHTEDGLNLREDFGTGISVPEYVKGGQSKPSAYVKNKSVKIKVRILVDPPTITSLKIKGLSDDADGSLGDVAEKTVTFSGGVSQSGVANDPSTAINEAEFIEFAVNGNTPNAVHKSTDAWKWVITGANGTTLPAMEIDRTSGHTIYTVLDVPAQPWTQAPGAQCNVWSKALEVVCGNEWAGGAATTKDAAAGITRKLYSVGAYNPDGGSVRQFDKAGNLALGRLIRLSCMDFMNCKDIASVVSALGNAVGCDNARVELSKLLLTFESNRVWPLPGKAFPAGWTSANLTYHEVAVGDDGVFDACFGFQEEGLLGPRLRLAEGVAMEDYLALLVPPNATRPSQRPRGYPSVK